MYEGSCLCGSVSYQIDGEFGDFDYCHCRSCRKASGTAHAANASVDRSKFRLNDPDENLKEYESSPGKLRSFCSRCGSPLFASHTEWPHILRIRLGTLDTHFEGLPNAHFFVSEKASWYVIEGDLPQLQEG